MIKFLKNLFVPDINFRQLLHNGAVVIDVRSEEEFKHAHLKGSTNIPLESINKRINEIKKMGKPIVTVCRSGVRSNAAKNILENNGIKAYNAGSWISLQKKMIN